MPPRFLSWQSFNFILSSTTVRKKFQFGLKMSVRVNKFGRLSQHFTSFLALLGLTPDHQDLQFLFLNNPTGVFFRRNEGNCCTLKPAWSRAQADVKAIQGFSKPTSMRMLGPAWQSPWGTTETLGATDGSLVWLQTKKT